ncbi:MAG: PPE domain-containing protein [Pseudonocardiales bacterium]|nr:PPE domain-containing protein [Pseudonocardiales bacterium]MBV9032674.1 PPE domain-containing protein [Pseudonocardiales bacterium]MBW0010743.1 PPE domain-containing protein [Pseudonocardiales bacterium]
MSGAGDVVADVLGFGGSSGTDHGSSNWAAWGHPEIRSMLDTSVDPGDISDAASAWREQGRNTVDVITGLTHDLKGIVAGGWRGGSADAALTALDPISQWSAGQADVAERTTELMDASGLCAGQAKTTVPPPKFYDWGESLTSLAAGGVPGAVVDAVAQEREQSQLHADAVRIMTDVYSAPINDYRAAVPMYAKLVDPTLRPPEHLPKPGPAPRSAYPGAGAPGAGAPGGGMTGAGAPGGGVGTQGGGRVAHTLSAPTAGTQPSPVALQSVTSGVPVSHGGGQVVSDQGTHRHQQVGGQVAAAAVTAAAGVPVMGQIAGGVRRARAAGGVRLGGGEVGGSSGGGGRAGAGHPAEFGPRPSTVAEEGQPGAGPGRGATGMGFGRANPGEMMAPMGGGRGRGGEDSEHRRPSYLIEMDDIFTDGRKVAPAVIGQDPPEQDD